MEKEFPSTLLIHDLDFDPKSVHQKHVVNCESPLRARTQRTTRDSVARGSRSLTDPIWPDTSSVPRIFTNNNKSGEYRPLITTIRQTNRIPNASAHTNRPTMTRPEKRMDRGSCSSKTIERFLETTRSRTSIIWYRVHQRAPESRVRKGFHQSNKRALSFKSSAHFCLPQPSEIPHSSWTTSVPIQDAVNPPTATQPEPQRPPPPHRRMKPATHWERTRLRKQPIDSQAVKITTPGSKLYVLKWELRTWLTWHGPAGQLRTTTIQHSWRHPLSSNLTIMHFWNEFGHSAHGPPDDNGI